MAKTLLDSVNAVLIRAKIIPSTGTFTSLTNSARQTDIDVCVQVINEGLHHLYMASPYRYPLEGAETTVTLVEGEREYDLPADLVEIVFPLIDRTKAQYIFQYQSGFDNFLVSNPRQNLNGLPYFGMINPNNGKLYLDRICKAEQAGRVYTVQYQKELILTSESDTMPFNDTAWYAMVPAWKNLFERDIKRDFDAGIFAANIGRAAKTLSKLPARTSWSPRRGRASLGKIGYIHTYG